MASPADGNAQNDGGSDNDPGHPGHIDPGGFTMVAWEYSKSTMRVQRGGSYSDGADDARSTTRGYNGPGGRGYNQGFRVAR